MFQPHCSARDKGQKYSRLSVVSSFICSLALMVDGEIGFYSIKFNRMRIYYANFRHSMRTLWYCWVRYRYQLVMAFPKVPNSICLLLKSVQWDFKVIAICIIISNIKAVHLPKRNFHKQCLFVRWLTKNQAINYEKNLPAGSLYVLQVLCKESKLRRAKWVLY